MNPSDVARIRSVLTAAVDDVAHLARHLESLPRTEIVGLACQITESPLPKWLSYVAGLEMGTAQDPEVSVEDSCAPYMGVFLDAAPEDEIVTLPLWAINFTYLLDTAACEAVGCSGDPDGGCDTYHGITAGLALDVLHKRWQPRDDRD
jgi:hypothetical protein